MTPHLWTIFGCISVLFVIGLIALRYYGNPDRYRDDYTNQK